MILKGAASSVYYPRPSLRTYGDIDILVAEDDYLRAKSVLAANGFTEKVYRDTSHNTTLLDVDGVVKKLMSTDYVKEELEGRPHIVEA